MAHLMLHGKNDPAVPVAYNEIVFAAIPNRKSFFYPCRRRAE